MRNSAADERQAFPFLERHQRLLCRAATAIALACTGALIVGIALRRHIHIDEFHNVFSIQLVGSFGHAGYADPAELYHVLFAPLARQFTTTRAMFSALRLVWGTLFLGLLAAAAWVQPFFPGPWGRMVAFIAGASWWPAWRHGAEIRHDTLLAFGLVALYQVAWSAESERLTARSAAAAGAAAAWMQLDSHKAATLWGPALLWIVLLQARRGRTSALHAAGYLGAGLSGGLLSGFALLALGGTLGAYFDQLAHFARYAATAERFSALPVFELMLRKGSVLSGCALLLIPLSLGLAVRRRLPPLLGTTAAFLAFTLLALAVNPVPYPYNLVWVTPAMLFGGLAVGRWLLERAGRLRLPLLAASLVCCVAQFWSEMDGDEYLHRTWDVELRIIEAAEALTAPSDPVFDGVGMVCTRPPATRDWLLHSVFMPEYRDGRREQVRDVIARARPPVLIGGHYRFSGLTDADRSAIASHYIAVSNQLWVLGAHTSAGENHVEILRAGRYLLLTPEPAPEFDGRPLADHEVLSLAAGTHLVHGAVTLAWLGPNLRELPTNLAVGTFLFAPNQLPGQL
ncbi:MAG TPA: hypothetical protein VFS67_21005 [Polyangiaceae bacterium]|nr:hypothetical protein [Polyangiaceae bacterium]